MQPRSLKILYLTTIKEIHLNILLDVCQRFGHQVHLVGRNVGDQEHDNVIWHRPNLWNRLRRRVGEDDPFRFYTRWARTVVKKIQPDVIHALGADFWGAVAIEAATGVPVMVSCLGGDINHRSWWTDAQRERIRKTLSGADVVHTNSGPALTQFISRQYGLDPAKVLSMPWGIEYQQVVDILNGVNLGAVRDRYNINADDFVILAPRGMRDVFSNIINLIPAVIRLMEQDISPRVIIRTHGIDKELRSKVQAQITTNGLEDRFISIKDFLPYEDVISLHAIADTMVSIAKNDQPAAVILETMLADTIPVISDLEVYRDVFKAGENVLYIDDTSPEDIARQLIKVARMPDSEQKQVCKANAAIVAEGYDSHKNGAKLNAAWQTLAKIKQQYAVPDS